MERKKFLSSLFAAGTFVPGVLKGVELNDDPSVQIVPPYLKQGALIGITCPAGFITAEEIQPAIEKLTSWGFQVRIGNTIGLRDNSFGGTDEQRAADLQQMLDDESLAAILSARGGYGSVRLIDSLNFEKFKKKPKWIIGFSDITVLHCHINRNFGIASIHSKMCNSFPSDWSKAEPEQISSIESIRLALTGSSMRYNTKPNINNKIGKAEGVLIGGNLKTIETLAGTKSDIKTKNKILFVEDTGEYLYSIDRMFWNLKRTGKLEELKGLIIGGFKIKPDDPGEEFGKTLYDIVLEKVKKFNYPVCFDFPVGHQKENYALKCGSRHKLEVSTAGTQLSEF